MSQFGKIDDPLDASFEAWPGEKSNAAGEAAITVGEILSHWAALGALIRDRFLSTNRAARFDYLLEAVRLKFVALEKQMEGIEGQIKAVSTRVASAEFEDATAVAAEESVRANSLQKIDQFASVLVGSLTPNQWADPREDVAVMIRDVAQLGERYLKVLGMLETVHASAIASAPNLYEPDAFSRETAALMRDIRSSGFHLDDFLSTCERLRGFGLAAEVLRNTSHMAPHDYCYRPTRRGLAVLAYLRATRGV